jgi:hypothetical protein
LSMLDDPPQDHHAHILRTYNQQATERAHQLRRTPALFEGIPLSEKTCVYEWDRTEEIERERVSKITGAKQTLQKEEANASHKQVITKNTKEAAATSRPPAKTSPTQVHPPPPPKKGYTPSMRVSGRRHQRTQHSVRRPNPNRAWRIERRSGGSLSGIYSKRRVSLHGTSVRRRRQRQPRPLL